MPPFDSGLGGFFLHAAQREIPRDQLRAYTLRKLVRKNIMRNAIRGLRLNPHQHIENKNMTTSLKPKVLLEHGKAVQLPNGWRSMRSAPRDGTMILVCETPNSEHFNVMAASYQLHLGNEHLEGFWGVWPSSRLPPHLHQECDQLVRARGLPVDFKAVAITPLCWQPMPACEAIEKLRRRASQVYAAKARARSAPTLALAVQP